MRTAVQYRERWLPITENWIYNQVRRLTRYAPVVYCHITMNLETFPAAKLRVLDLADAYSPGPLFNIACRKLFGVWPGFWFPMRKDRPDIIHAHFGPAGYHMLGFTRRLGIPLVTTFYGADVGKLPSTRPEWRGRYAQLFREGDLFLVEGNHMGRCLAELGCPEGKIVLQRLGVELDRIPFLPRSLDGSGEVRVLVCSSFREKKGIPYAVEAFGLVRRRSPGLKLKLTIIGDRGADPEGGEEKARILSMIERYGLREDVRLLGLQPNDVFHSELRRHHLFLAPSVTASNGDTEGGAPVAVIEASASGMPVLSTRHCDIPEVVLDKESGYLVAERDSAALADRLELLASRDGDWAGMGERGRRHIERNHDVVRQAARLEDIYDGLCGRTR